MELEPSNPDFDPKPDRRPKMPEPLPVRVIAINDSVSHAVAGREKEMDEFYVTVLGFARANDVSVETNFSVLIYHAENVDLSFTIREPIFHRDDLRPVQIEVQSLRVTEQAMIDREMPYTRQRGLAPGQESLVLQDPSGNWVEITERRQVG
ncbi:MAG TPA: hypothetical protein PLD59_06035 [Tepidisphaeraceae bacterium]|nr:hypothetical protein [Tepidisphaeraceae bacterium]